MEDYLAPRCYHVDPQNPCTCTGRLVIAIDAAFVKPPPHTDRHSARSARRRRAAPRHGEPVPQHPKVQLSETDTAALLNAVG